MVDFFRQAQSLFEQTRQWRRDFHMHPELGFNEIRTAGIVAHELDLLGIEITRGVAETGVVGILEGVKPGPVVLLRFDMDALPIQEETGAEYASQNPGVMHACGHDGHTAVGLTIAKMLNSYRKDLRGTIKFVFQPAEEGMGGATRMVQEGVLENPKPDVSMGMHVWNDQPIGWVGIASGPIMAAAEIFKIRINGKGGHGAIPHLAIDPVYAAAQIINSLQSIVSRNVSPLQSAVISVTSIHGGDTFNVIPPSVLMEGTIRSMEPEVRRLVIDRFEKVVRESAGSLNCEAEVKIQPLTSSVINHPKVTEFIQAVAASTVPSVEIGKNFKTMGSEDMAAFMTEIPGCFIFVGSANEKLGLHAPHHHPKFDIDENALVTGAAILASAAFAYSNS